MKYTIHGKTIFIKGNGIIGHYMVDGDKVFKVVDHYSGEQIRQDFHTIGSLPLNSEAKLLNELRSQGLI